MDDTAWLLFPTVPVVIEPTDSSAGQKFILLHDGLHFGLGFVFCVLDLFYYFAH